MLGRCMKCGNGWRRKGEKGSKPFHIYSNNTLKNKGILVRAWCILLCSLELGKNELHKNDGKDFGRDCPRRVKLRVFKKYAIRESYVIFWCLSSRDSSHASFPLLQIHILDNPNWPLIPLPFNETPKISSLPLQIV